MWISAGCEDCAVVLAADAALAGGEPAGDDQQHLWVRGGAGAAGVEGRGQVLAARRLAP